ncbi:MAG: serine/threonine protein kinase [Sandaracinaceae bacterium]
MRTCPQCGTRFEQALQFCPHDGSPTYEVQDKPDPSADPLLGRVIDGRYRIEKRIGEGGMGVVYMATHTVLQKKLALKVLRSDSSKDGETVQRFMQEAQAATSIGHQNIIDISDFGRLPDGSVYFVMEYLDGTSLNALIKKGGSVPMQSAIHIIRQIASALEAAHARGIVHRDLKPDNIFVIRQGSDPQFVKVLDFGVAKVGGAASKLTKTGMVFGTPHYMSPEQAAGHTVDQRTDVYALGVIMYEMFTGKVPFDADTFMGILSKHMFEAPAPPTDTHGASLGALESVILKALEKSPEGRYQSMSDLTVDLDTIAAGGNVEFVRQGVAPPPGNLADALEPPSVAELAARPSAEQPSSGRGFALAAVAALVLLLVGGAVGTAVFVFSADEDGQAQAQPPTTSGPAHPAEAQTTAIAASASSDRGAGTPGGATTPGTAAAQGTPTGPGSPTGQGTGPEAGGATPDGPTTPVATIHLTSEPTGAEVLVDGVMIGNTPADIPKPASGSQHVTLRARGFAPSEISLSPASGDTLHVSLEQERIATGSRRGRSSTSTMPVINRPPPVISAPPPPSGGGGGGRRSTSEVVDPWAQ